jgi:phage terminase Nu1 subunit (DNA packaging protein)
MLEVGKKALCEHLGWSRPTLDARLKADPNFPVRERGGKGGGWKFIVEDVRAYLQSGQTFVAAPPATEDEDDDAPDVAEPWPISPIRRTDHSGEATATQRLRNAQAAIQEDRLRRQRGELVEAKDMQQVLSTALAELRSSLSDLPAILGKEFMWSEREITACRLRTEEAMRTMARRVRDKLTDA